MLQKKKNVCTVVTVYFKRMFLTFVKGNKQKRVRMPVKFGVENGHQIQPK